MHLQYRGAKISSKTFTTVAISVFFYYYYLKKYLFRLFFSTFIFCGHQVENILLHIPKFNSIPTITRLTLTVTHSTKTP